MDLVFSVPVVIFVLPPLCLVVKIFQAIQSPGPLFYRQTRAGVAKRPFRIFKFRTMREDQAMLLRSKRRQVTRVFIRWGASYERRALMKYRNFSMCSLAT